MSSMELRLPSPTDVVRAAFLPLEWSLDTARVVVALPARVLTLLDSAEELVARIDLVVAAAAAVVARVEETVQAADGVIARVDGTVTGADAVVVRVDGVVDGAGSLVGRAGTLVGRAAPLLDFAETTVDRLAPMVEAVLVEQGIEIEQARLVTARVAELAAFADRVLLRLQPAIEQVVDSIDPDEVAAVVELINHLPALTQALEKDVLPVLSTMDTVAPEVHQILAVTQDCLEALAGIPGFNILRRRGENRVDADGPSAVDATREQGPSDV